MTNRIWLMVLTATAGAMLSGQSAKGADLAIQSFDNHGQLTFCGISNASQYATGYRIEWASAAGGPWTNWSAALTNDSIPAPANGTGSVTVLVPMFYRVVASVTNLAPSGMVLINAGNNTGSDPDFGAYNLTVSAFYMDSTLVTKAKWDEVYTWAIAHGYTFANAGSGKAANHPVHTVSWHDCAKWCNARSEKEGRPVSYRVGGNVYRGADDNSVTCATNVAGYRLPTDVEFHYAARGGLVGKRFPWGDTIDHTMANYYGYWTGGSPYCFYDAGYEGFDTRFSTPEERQNWTGTPWTSPVDTFPANGFGLYDMAGNLWEWCADWYPGNEGSSRVYRGGRWDSYAGNCRFVIFQNYDSPDVSTDYIGFRAVLPPGQ